MGFGRLFWVGCILGVIFSACQDSRQTSLCGTWRMTSGEYSGENFSVSENENTRICYKILSPRNFAVIEMFPNNPDSLFFAAFGTYDLSDTAYVEHYTASNVPGQIGETTRFHSEIDGDIWRIRLHQQDMKLRETWQRVQHAPTEF
jgi:hypothetical protein